MLSSKSFRGALDDGLLDTNSVSLTSFQRSAFIVIGPSGAGKSTLLQKIAAIDESIVTLRVFSTRERRASDCSRQIEFTTQDEFFSALNRSELFYAKRKRHLYSKEYFVGYKKSAIHDALLSGKIMGMTSHAGFASLVNATLPRVPIIILTATPSVLVSRILKRDAQIQLSEYESEREAIKKVTISNENIQKLELLIGSVGGSVLKLNTEQIRLEECSMLAHYFVKQKIAQNQ
jgi:guanylate kinase